MSPTTPPARSLPSQIPLDTDDNAPAPPPSLPFLHLWTGQDGDSRLNLPQLPGFGSKSVGGGAAPQWLRPFPGEVLDTGHGSNCAFDLAQRRLFITGGSALWLLELQQRTRRAR